MTARTSVELREALAEAAHDAWSGWMVYMFSLATIDDSDGTLTIPKPLVERWLRQMKTPYVELSEDEKQSDRMEADRYLAVINDTRTRDTKR
jgi:hypothetical protein